VYCCTCAACGRSSGSVLLHLCTVWEVFRKCIAALVHRVGAITNKVLCAQSAVLSNLLIERHFGV
jgi:hypothetical protein